MSEMVERVAKAICESFGLDWEAQKSAMTSGGGSDEEQDGYREAARAAFAAIREPTAAMIEAASRTDRETDQYCATGEEHWTAMIDEVLK